MKACRDCNIPKEDTEYYVKLKEPLTMDVVCKSCRREIARQYRIKNPKPPKPKTPRMDGFRLLPEGMRKCGDCKEVKEKELFYVDNKRASGTSTYCKECTTRQFNEKMEIKGDEILAYRRKWAEDNREGLREKNRQYREENRDKRTVTEASRRARKKSLPDTLTHEETNDILAHFDGKCALCENPSEALDHFIPLYTNCGGTTKENIIPLCREMNSSKSARNPFEWADTHLSEGAQQRFSEVIKYLSELNGLTVEQYREFVFSCFKIKPKNKNIS